MSFWDTDNFKTKYRTSDKFAHMRSFFEFMIVMFIAMSFFEHCIIALAQGAIERSFWYNLIFTIIIAEFLGTGYEIFQGFFSHGASWRDWLMNQIGIILGSVVLLVFYYWRNICF